VGYEVFDRFDPAAADAEVFALIAQALEGLSVRAVTGDIGVLMAAVQGLETTTRRKRALMRHIWRPARFRALLDRFSGRAPVPESRIALLAGQVTSDAPLTGLRSQAEIDARIAALKEDAGTAPIAAGDVALIEALLDLRAMMPQAVAQLTALAGDMPQIAGAVAGVAAREAALRARGIDTDALVFEASYGRTTMEYYDGFVFGFRAQDRDDLPEVASGGRYDALTRRLGQENGHGGEIPAVGGVMRPGLMLDLEGAP
jgi:ATP phosphoribosyltransferase regulatory subunit